MSDDLKPCPFCGGEATVGYWAGGNSYSASCRDWMCPSKTQSFGTSAAITAWNTRADVVVLQARREGWDMAIEAAAYQASNACLVPPDGGSPTEAEADMCEESARRIRAITTPEALK